MAHAGEVRCGPDFEVSLGMVLLRHLRGKISADHSLRDPSLQNSSPRWDRGVHWRDNPAGWGYMNVSYFCRCQRGASVTTWLAVVAGLCCSAPTDPQDLLTVDVTVTPSVVSPGDSLLVTLTIANPTPFPIRLGSGDSCVALPVVYAEGERVEWEGTGLRMGETEPCRCNAHNLV